MTTATLEKIVAVGVLSGMRSMAGAATLAVRGGGMAAPPMALLAAGEMLADKTAVVGDRIDPLPLAGRAVMGAVAGGVVAREAGVNTLVGVVLGAATAVAAAHVAYRLRTRLPLSSPAAGLLEDVVVLALASRYA